MWFEDDHMQDWGILVLVNRSKTYSQYPCCDEMGDILTIEKDSGGEIETTPSHVYQLAPGREFHGYPVVWEHQETMEDYPFYCPGLGENCFHFEVEGARGRDELTVQEAERELLSTLDNVSFGDKVYELAQDLYQGGISMIESSHGITGTDLFDSGEMWYDSIREEFFQEVYNKLSNFLAHGE